MDQNQAMGDFTDQLATELERVAADLRASEARVYGHDIAHGPATVQSGRIAYSGGHVNITFEYD